MTDLLIPTPATATVPGPLVIGLDTSLTATGIASSRGWCDTVGYTDKKNPFTKLPHPRRLEAMAALLGQVLLTVGHPDLVVLESPSFASLGGGGHERAWLWWELYRTLTGRGVPVGLMAPSLRMLYATGKGSATKSAVVDAVARRWPNWATGGDDNQADAVVLMAAGRDWLGQPLADMPKPHRVAVERAVWPEGMDA